MAPERRSPPNPVTLRIKASTRVQYATTDDYYLRTHPDRYDADGYFGQSLQFQSFSNRYPPYIFDNATVFTAPGQYEAFLSKRTDSSSIMCPKPHLNDVTAMCSQVDCTFYIGDTEALLALDYLKNGCQRRSGRPNQPAPATPKPPVPAPSDSTISAWKESGLLTRIPRQYPTTTVPDPLEVITISRNVWTGAPTAPCHKCVRRADQLALPLLEACRGFDCHCTSTRPPTFQGFRSFCLNKEWTAYWCLPPAGYAFTGSPPPPANIKEYLFFPDGVYPDSPIPRLVTSKVANTLSPPQWTRQVLLPFTTYDFANQADHTRGRQLLDLICLRDGHEKSIPKSVATVLTHLGYPDVTSMLQHRTQLVATRPGDVLDDFLLRTHQEISSQVAEMHAQSATDHCIRRSLVHPDLDPILSLYNATFRDSLTKTTINLDATYSESTIRYTGMPLNEFHHLLLLHAHSPPTNLDLPLPSTFIDRHLYTITKILQHYHLLQAANSSVPAQPSLTIDGHRIVYILDAKDLLDITNIIMVKVDTVPYFNLLDASAFNARFCGLPFSMPFPIRLLSDPLLKWHGITRIGTRISRSRPVPGKPANKHAPARSNNRTTLHKTTVLNRADCPPPYSAVAPSNLAPTPPPPAAGTRSKPPRRPTSASASSRPADLPRKHLQQIDKSLNTCRTQLARADRLLAEYTGTIKAKYAFTDADLQNTPRPTSQFDPDNLSPPPTRRATNNPLLPNDPFAPVTFIQHRLVPTYPPIATAFVPGAEAPFFREDNAVVTNIHHLQRRHGHHAMHADQPQVAHLVLRPSLTRPGTLAPRPIPPALPLEPFHDYDAHAPLFQPSAGYPANMDDDDRHNNVLFAYNGDFYEVAQGPRRRSSSCWSNNLSRTHR